MITAIGSLTMVGLNTASPQVFLNGVLIPNVTGIRVDWESDERRVKLKVSDIDPAMAAALLVAGVTVKREKTHE